MTRLIPPIIIAGATSGAGVAASTYAESHAIGLPTAASIAVFVGGAMLWLAQQFSKRDKADAEWQTLVKERLTRIETRFEDLPCIHNGCPPRTAAKRKAKRR